MLTGIVYGIIAMIASGLASATAQKPIKALGSIKAIFYRNIVISVFLFIVLLFNIPETISYKRIGLAILIAFLGYIPFVTFFKSLGTGKIGIVVPIANSATIFTVILSIIFLKERFQSLQAFAIALIILGIILISINFKDFKKSHLFHAHSGVPYALITCLLWGIFFFVWKTPITWLGPYLSAFVQEAAMALYSALHLGITKESFKITKKHFVFVLAPAAFMSIATLFFNLGLNIGPVSIVAPLVFANPLVSTIYSRIFYKEQLSRQQWLALLLIIAGIVLVSI